MASLGFGSPPNLARTRSRLLLLESGASSGRKTDKTFLQPGGEEGGEVAVKEQGGGGGGGEQLLCASGTLNPVTP